jgi:hypothetical protein
MDETNVGKSGKARKILKISAAALLGVFVVSTIGHFLWLGSSSGGWQFQEERDGIKIWTQKVRDNPLLKGRAQFRVKSTLGGIVKIVYDPVVHQENNMMKVTFLESAQRPGYYAVFNSFTQAMPPPLTTREFVLLSQHVQDRNTKAIQLNALAAPNKIPASDCCVRLVHVHNRYTLTPQDNGEVEIEFFWDVDLGGAVPYALQNVMLPEALYMAMNDFRKLIQKYHRDTVAYIDEVGPGPVPGST